MFYFRQETKPFSDITLMFILANCKPTPFFITLKTFKASLYSSEEHFIFNNVLLMNRQLALKVFKIDKETSGNVNY